MILKFTEKKVNWWYIVIGSSKTQRRIPLPMANCEFRIVRIGMACMYENIRWIRLTVIHSFWAVDFKGREIVFIQFSANNYLTTNQLLLNRQSGFHSFHSTVIALLEDTDSWTLNVDHGLVNAVVLLDLRKVFDTVDHDILWS